MPRTQFARVAQQLVNCRAGGTAVEQVLVPASEAAPVLVLSVAIEVIEEFDGDATTTVDVGIDGSADDFIAAADGSTLGPTVMDPADGAVVTADVLATWTNAADATEGQFRVVVVWVPLT